MDTGNQLFTRLLQVLIQNKSYISTFQNDPRGYSKNDSCKCFLTCNSYRCIWEIKLLGKVLLKITSVSYLKTFCSRITSSYYICLCYWERTVIMHTVIRYCENVHIGCFKHLNITTNAVVFLMKHIFVTLDSLTIWHLQVRHNKATSLLAESTVFFHQTLRHKVQKYISDQIKTLLIWLACLRLRLF